MLDATNSYAKRIQRVGYCVYTMCYRHTGAAIESGTGTTVRYNGNNGKLRTSNKSQHDTYYSDYTRVHASLRQSLFSLVQ
jgi:hypothetical protein